MCDVSDADRVVDALDAILGAFGRIDILVNNAGVGGRFAPIQEQTNEDWRRVIGIDLTGVFSCCRAVVPHMIGRSCGRIINVSSLAGKEGSPDMVPYSAAKAGIIGLTKALAREVAKHNITVNVVSPAIIVTPLLDEMPHEKKQLLLERTPVGRCGRAEEVAAMVHWLASDDASYSTGAIFDLSGGRATY
jgi:NAD(P)-dependent dehydrogenase (short-subunit alcohol dehydrogenase family)